MRKSKTTVLASLILLVFCVATPRALSQLQFDRLSEHPRDDYRDAFDDFEEQLAESKIEMLVKKLEDRQTLFWNDGEAYSLTVEERQDVQDKLKISLEELGLKGDPKPVAEKVFQELSEEEVVHFFDSISRFDKAVVSAHMKRGSASSDGAELSKRLGHVQVLLDSGMREYVAYQRQYYSASFQHLGPMPKSLTRMGLHLRSLPFSFHDMRTGIELTAKTRCLRKCCQEELLPDEMAVAFWPSIGVRGPWMELYYGTLGDLAGVDPLSPEGRRNQTFRLLAERQAKEMEQLKEDFLELYLQKFYDDLLTEEQKQVFGQYVSRNTSALHQAHSQPSKDMVIVDSGADVVRRVTTPQIALAQTFVYVEVVPDVELGDAPAVNLQTPNMDQGYRIFATDFGDVVPIDSSQIRRLENEYMSVNRGIAAVLGLDEEALKSIHAAIAKMDVRIDQPGRWMRVEEGKARIFLGAVVNSPERLKLVNQVFNAWELRRRGLLGFLYMERVRKVLKLTTQQIAQMENSKLELQRIASERSAKLLDKWLKEYENEFLANGQESEKALVYFRAFMEERPSDLVLYPANWQQPFSDK